MSEDESFVILGTSPTSSMETNSSITENRSLQTPQNNQQNEMSTTLSATSKSSIINNQKINFQLKTSTSSSSDVDFSLLNHSINNVAKSTSIKKKVNLTNFVPCVLNDESTTNMMKISKLERDMESMKIDKNPNQLIKSNNGFAADFLIGSVGIDEIKGNVMAEYLSLSSNSFHKSVEDIPIDMQMQDIIKKYNTMKDQLSHVNNVLSVHVTCLSSLQNEVKKTKEEQLNSTINLQNQIDKLQQENAEFKEIVKVMQNDLNSKQSISEQKKFITMSEHIKIIKDIENELSEKVAEKLEIKNMQQTYIDEINCLKVNLTCAEESLKKAQIDINELKVKEIDKMKFIENYQKEQNRLKEEIELLRSQIKVYLTDFNSEHVVKEKLMVEKEQLIHDLKMLQKRNKQLIAESQSRIAIDTKPKCNDAGVQVVPTTSKPPEPKNNFKDLVLCPICFKKFYDLKSQQDHIDICIKRI